MHKLPWERAELIAEIRDKLWHYLTPAASIEEELLQAASLLQLPAHEIRTLGRVQFLISREVGELLEQLPFLTRRLATTTASEEEWSADRVRGAIQWGRTIGVRQASGIPHLYVTAPARRAYQTPENELLVLVLDAIVLAGRALGWHRSTSEAVGRLVSGRVSEAQRWLQLRALGEVERRPMTASRLARVRGGRHRRRYATVLSAYDRYRLLAAKLDRAAIRAAVETNGLVSRDDPTLFELLCTFRTIDALRAHGWQLGRLGLFQGALRLKGTRDKVQLTLSYQTTPRALSAGSTYRHIQHAHGISPGGLRPDLVIETSEAGASRWLLLEVKGGDRDVTDSARAAAYDLLAYRTAFAPQLDDQPGVYGLGIAWGGGLEPTFAAGVSLCTPDTLDRALEHLLS